MRGGIAGDSTRGGTAGGRLAGVAGGLVLRTGGGARRGGGGAAEGVGTSRVGRLGAARAGGAGTGAVGLGGGGAGGLAGTGAEGFAGTALAGGVGAEADGMLGGLANNGGLAVKSSQSIIMCNWEQPLYQGYSSQLASALAYPQQKDRQVGGALRQQGRKGQQMQRATMVHHHRRCAP